MRIVFIMVWLTLAAGAVAAMFHITFEVEKLEARLHEVNRQIVEEQEAIHVLQAEWSYLNRPQRLESLSRELLPKLAPVAAVQFTTFARLPKRGALEHSDSVPGVTPASFPVTRDTPASRSIEKGHVQ